MYLLDLAAVTCRLVSFLFKNGKSMILYLFGRDLVKIEVESDTLLITPRSIDITTVIEIYQDKGYVPRHPASGACCETVLDIGANIGVFSVWALSHLNAKRVVAVEASRSNFKVLLKNTAPSGNRIKAINKALYSVNGVVGIDPTRKSRSAWVSIDPQGTKEVIESLTLSRLIEDEKIGTIDFLKMDIEGAEKYVLTPENRNLFENRIQYVIVEAHTKDGYRPEMAVAYLQDAGYDVVSEKILYPVGYKTNWMVYAKNMRI